MDVQRLISLTLITEELKNEPLNKSSSSVCVRTIPVHDILHLQVTFKRCGRTFYTWLESIDRALRRSGQTVCLTAQHTNKSTHTYARRDTTLDLHSLKIFTKPHLILIGWAALEVDLNSREMLPQKSWLSGREPKKQNHLSGVQWTEVTTMREFEVKLELSRGDSMHV